MEQNQQRMEVPNLTEVPGNYIKELQACYIELKGQNVALQRQIQKLQGTHVNPAKTIKHKLSKASNPVTFNIKLFERMITGDTTLHMEAFCHDECYRDKIHLAVGDGQQLLVKNLSANRLAEL